MLEHATAFPVHQPREGEAVTAGMKLCLVLEAHRRLDGPRQIRLLGVARGEAGCPRRLHLPLDLADLRVLLGVGVRGPSLPIAMDSMLADEPLDEVDRRHVRLRVGACAVLADRRAQRRVAEAVLGAHLRSGVAGRRAADASCFKHRDAQTHLLQEQRRRQACDAGA